MGPDWSCTGQIKADTAGVRGSKIDLSEVWDSINIGDLYHKCYGNRMQEVKQSTNYQPELNHTG